MPLPKRYHKSSITIHHTVENDIVTERIMSQMMRFGLVLDKHSCLTLFADVACLSSDISVMPMPVKTVHSRALKTRTLGPSKVWRRKIGRPRQSWLTTEWMTIYVRAQFRLATARLRTSDRPAWRLLVKTATSTRHAPILGEIERYYNGKHIYNTLYRILIYISTFCYVPW